MYDFILYSVVDRYFVALASYLRLCSCVGHSIGQYFLIFILYSHHCSPVLLCWLMNSISK